MAEHTPHEWLRTYLVFAVVAGNQYYRIWQYEGDATYWGELYGHGLPSKTRAGFESQAAAEDWLTGLAAHIAEK